MTVVSTSRGVYKTLGLASIIARYSMNLAIELPDDIAQALRKRWGDLSNHTLELLAVDGYRAGLLTAEQLHRMLSLRTRCEVEEFLKQRGISLADK